CDASSTKLTLESATGRDLRFVSEDEISEDFKSGELDIFRAKAAADGKPEKMLDQIAEGMWKKSLTDYVLLNQASIRPEDDGKTIETLRAELSGTIGENIQVKRFARFEVGAEGAPPRTAPPSGASCSSSPARPSWASGSTGRTRPGSPRSPGPCATCTSWAPSRPSSWAAATSCAARARPRRGWTAPPPTTRACWRRS